MIACCRVEDIDMGETNAVRIERVAVDKKYRNKVFGRAIMEIAEAFIEQTGKYKKISVNAQEQVIHFMNTWGISYK